MPAPVALTALIASVRQRADMENTLFVSDSEVGGYIQASYGELFDLILEAAGPEVFTRQAVAITTVAGTSVYAIYEVGTTDAQVYKTMRVTLSDSGVPRRLLPGADVGTVADGVIGTRGMPSRYSLVGPTILRASTSSMTRQLLLDPCPDAAYSVYVMYVPVPPDLTTAATQNLYSFSGWEEYIICDAAAKCLEKEESFEAANQQLRRKMAAEQRIRWHARTLTGDGGGKIRDMDDTYCSPWGSY